MDGKTLRGARAGDGRAVHVLAAMLAGTRTVVGQREIAHKPNEITAFAPLLDGLDRTGVLVSADALRGARSVFRGSRRWRLGLLWSVAQGGKSAWSVTWRGDDAKRAQERQSVGVETGLVGGLAQESSDGVVGQQ